MKTEAGAGAVPGRPPGSCVRHHVAAATGARLQGYSIAPDGGASTLRLMVAGQPVAHVVRRIDRPDLRALQAQAMDDTRALRLESDGGEESAAAVRLDSRVGFFVEVDASAWQRATPDGRVNLQVEIDGVPAGAPITLDARALAQWVRALAGWRRPDEREVWRVLAHVAVSARFERLPRRAREWLDAAARSRGLSEAFRAGDPGGRIALGARPRAGLAVVGPLAIAGWAFDPDGARPGFTIETSRGGWAAEAQWHEEPACARDLDAPNSTIGFTLAVPATAWTHVDDTGRCPLHIRLQGRPLVEFMLDVDTLRAESAALARLLAHADATPRAAVARRLELLEAHVAALQPSLGWTPEDAAALGSLRATHDAPPPPVAAAGSQAGAGPPDAASTPPATLRTHLEGWETLILHGWAADLLAGGEIFELVAGGQVIECLVTRTNRVDVSRALGIAHEFPGFEIQLPSTLWRHADAHGAVDIVLRINGTPIVPEPLRLDSAAFERAVLALLPAPDQKLPTLASSAGMRLRLTAVPLLLEHIEARGGMARLSEPARGRLVSVGERLALGRLVGAHAPPLQPDAAARAALVLQRRVWRLQRLFNAALDRAGGRASPGVLAPTLAQVLDDPDAEGPARVQFLLSLAPLFCG
ncbi:MAG TPA: hypothetical protein VH328_08450, partial [Burkholderiaceae bacterium]|nr:hypothetical protein [Burkholderiaceae bacterium]